MSKNSRFNKTFQGLKIGQQVSDFSESKNVGLISAQIDFHRINSHPLPSNDHEKKLTKNGDNPIRLRLMRFIHAFKIKKIKKSLF